MGPFKLTFKKGHRGIVEGISSNWSLICGDILLTPGIIRLYLIYFNSILYDGKPWKQETSYNKLYAQNPFLLGKFVFCQNWSEDMIFSDVFEKDLELISTLWHTTPQKPKQCLW